MGAKYLPTIKDRKASQRYRRKQESMLQPKKALAVPPASKSTKK